jgi:CHAT domain-containing protein
VRLLILFIISCSFVFSQNEEISKESFLDKFQNALSEEELNNLFKISNNQEIISQFKKEELFGYRMLVLLDLVRLRNDNQEKYLNFSIDYFLKNKSLIDYNIVLSWSPLVDIIALLNSFKIYKPELKNLFNKLLELANYTREKKISENDIRLYETYDLDLALISWGLANYYDLIENKELALDNYIRTLDFLDIEKYYELFKTNIWVCLERSFYISLDKAYELKNEIQRESYLKQAEEYLTWINSVDLKNEEFTGAFSTKYNVNRSYAYRMKDYKKERIFIDKLIDLKGRTFENSRIDLFNKFNLNKIPKDDYIKKLKLLYDSYEKPYDQILAFHLDKDERYIAYLNLYSDKFKGLAYYNKLSYQDQIQQYKNRFNEFMILKGEFIRLNEGLKKIHLESFIQYLIKLENYSVNNKELFKKSDYSKISELLSEKKKLANFVDYHTVNEGEMSSTDIILNLSKYQDNIKFLEQEIKKDVEFSEVNLADIQKGLSENQAIVRIIQDFNKENFYDYYSIIITRNSLDFIKLNEKIDFERVYSYYLDKLNNRDEDLMSYKYLFKKIHQNMEGIEEIFFINKGIYANINLESLKLNSKDFLVDQIEIKYVSNLLGLNNKSESLDFKNSLLIGDPIFDIKKKKATPKKPNRSGFYQLPSTRDEINSINKILLENKINTVSLLGEDATEINFKNNLRSDLIHVATHGYYQLIDDFPSFGLVLANSGDSKLFEKNKISLYSDTDNILRGEELKYLNLSETNLLVLSACETAVSYPLMIGNYNLSEEFIRSGVKNVISTIWKVDDKVTQKFMTIFYDSLSKNNSIEYSLKITKSILRKEYPHPYYWAPFVHLKS